MQRLFSVSMPRSGHHVVEMVLRGLLNNNFGYCEFYTNPDCCKRIYCTRTGEFAAAGVTMFMQKSHDHELRDPIPDKADGILVQVRDPVARAMSNYELDLATVGPVHSLAYQRFWLGQEAAYTAGFFSKWCDPAQTRTLVLNYEFLLSDPGGYFVEIFKRFKIPKAFFNAEKVLSLQGRSSGDKQRFSQRDVSASTYYNGDNFACYGRLVGDAAALAGYQRPNGPANEPLETMFAAHMALLGGDAPAALGLINRYIETAEGASYGFSYRGRVNAVLGRREAALADLRRAVDIEPSFVGACRALADAEFKAGRPEVAIAAIRRCVAHAAAPARAMAQLLARLHMPPDMLARIEAEVAVPDGPGRTLLAREMVILAFQLILGREPENETVIEAHRKAGTILGLRRTLLGSPEFEQKYRKQFATG